MSVKQGIVLYGCFLIALSGCQSNTASSSSSSTQNQQSSSTQQSSSSSAQPQAHNSSNTPLNTNSVNSNIPATTAAATAGAETCSLLTSAEIESVRGEPVRETKGSAGNSSRFAVSQCFYSVATASKSVSLELTRRVANQASAASPRDFLREQFKLSERKRGNQRDTVGKKGVAPQKVAGVGDEAYWVGNAVTGALYVVKGDSFIRISIGGPEDEATKIEKLKTLAQLAVKRLKN